MIEKRKYVNAIRSLDISLMQVVVRPLQRSFDVTISRPWQQTPAAVG